MSTIFTRIHMMAICAGMMQAHQEWLRLRGRTESGVVPIEKELPQTVLLNGSNIFWVLDIRNQRLFLRSPQKAADALNALVNRDRQGVMYQ